MVLNQLHRKKMDPNREFADATQGSSVAAAAFNDYHGFINQTAASSSEPWLFLDIHGHTHAEQKAELGYLVYSSRLRSGDFTAEDTSIRSLVSRWLHLVSVEDALRGFCSLGAFMNSAGLRATPSPDEGAPAQGEAYFSGGYSTKIHGSRAGGTMDAIQIEIAREHRAGAGRPAFVAGLSQAVHDFWLTGMPNLG
jgi:hypothetical protein